MLQECKIIIPVNYNDGEEIENEIHDTLENHMIDLSGGFSRTLSTGHWKNPEDGKIYNEPVYPYTLALTKEQYKGLLSIARSAKQLCKQECIYISTPWNGVEFV